jgi:hypothetical protein
MNYTAIALLSLLSLSACKKKKEILPVVPVVIETPTIPGEASTTRFAEYLGINTFEWDFLHPASPENNRRNKIFSHQVIFGNTPLSGLGKD